MSEIDVTRKLLLLIC